MGHFSISRWNATRAHCVDIDTKPEPAAYVFGPGSDRNEVLQPVPGSSEDGGDEIIEGDEDGRTPVPRRNGPDQIRMVVEVAGDGTPRGLGDAHLDDAVAVEHVERHERGLDVERLRSGSLPVCRHRVRLS